MSLLAPLRPRAGLSRHAAALIAAAAALGIVPASAMADTSSEAESFALSPSSAGQVFTESAGSGGKSLKIWSNATASKSIATSDASAKLVIRARGVQCNGAPIVTVDVDGSRKLTATVSATSFADYSATVAIPAGTHTVKLGYANDYTNSSCDRNVFVDTVKLVSATTTTTPTPTPTPTTSTPTTSTPTTSTPTPTPTTTTTPTPTPSTTTTPTPTTTPTTTGKVIFNGDFENGAISQWSSVQRVAVDRLAIDSTSVRQGKYAAKVTVKGGDPLLYTGQRSELLWGSDNNLTLKSGDEYYFGWSTKFAADFPSPGTSTSTSGTGHCLFIQWKNGGTGSPPVDLECIKNRIQIGYSAKCGGWNIPLVRGGWNDFVVRIKFSSSSSVGFVEIWHKGPNDAAMTKKLDHCATATLNSGINSYLKLGYYRRNDETKTGIVWHDGMKVGTSFDAVRPL